MNQPIVLYRLFAGLGILISPVFLYIGIQQLQDATLLEEQGVMAQATIAQKLADRQSSKQVDYSIELVVHDATGAPPADPIRLNESVSQLEWRMNLAEGQVVDVIHVPGRPDIFVRGNVSGITRYRWTAWSWVAAGPLMMVTAAAYISWTFIGRRDWATDIAT